MLHPEHCSSFLRTISELRYTYIQVEPPHPTPTPYFPPLLSFFVQHAASFLQENAGWPLGEAALSAKPP